MFQEIFFPFSSAEIKEPYLNIAKQTEILLGLNG